jgi:hypothetical protein
VFPVKLPAAAFDKWTRWANLDQLACKAAPGVYLLALDVHPDEKVSTIDKRIVYIGQTCASLRQRWRQFQRAASGSEGEHSGGISFRKRCKGRSLEDLCVAPWAAPPMAPDVLRDAYIKFVERRLILDWVIKHRELPRCNTG